MPKGSDLLRRRVGEQLRQLREAKKMTLEQVAEKLGSSKSAISRIETGKTKIRLGDVREMLRLYGVPESEAEALVDLTRDARTKTGWWQPYSRLLPDWFRIYPDLEDEATTLHIYQVELVPGLLQTKAYARAVIQEWLLTEEPPEEDLDRRVESRAARQEAVLGRESPPKIWAVVDEGAIRRPIGGSDVMREQLRHLRAAADRPNIDLQILPHEVGAHAGLGAPFLILGLPANPDVVYIEHPMGSALLEQADQVERAKQVFSRLQAAALEQRQSLRLIDRIARDI